MKFFKLTSVIFLALPLTTALADVTVCKPINGTVAILAPDLSCQITALKNDYFPDITFLGQPGTCFTSTLNATLGNAQLTGTVLSAMTTNNLGGAGIAAASVITFKDANGYKLGKVFTQDTVVDSSGTTKEHLVMVDGTRMFKNGKGNLVISGNALTGPTTFSGKICAED